MSDEVLGDLSVARVRDDEDAIEQIAQLTSLTHRTIRRRLEGAHGKTLVHNVFDDEWPTDAAALGALRAKQARDVGLFVEIAGVTGLTERTVRIRLADAHHRASVRTVFAADWPSAQEPEPEQADDDAAPAEAEVGLGSMTTARARDDDDAIARIAALTGHTERGVRRRLTDASGMMLIRNVFAADWPTTVQALGDLRVKQARDFGLFPEIAGVLGWTEASVQAWLASADGRSSVRNFFASVWGEDEKEDVEPAAEDEEEDDVADEDADEPDEDEAPDDDDPIAALRLDPDGAWSRPRQLVRVLRELGSDLPQRLRTTRFQAVLLQLDQSGIQMRLADENDPLPPDAASPGIDSRVCLRVAVAPAEPRRPPAPRVNAPSAPPPPIVLVSAPRQPPRLPAPPPRDSDYELALLRLQFLTAVPSMDRQRQPEWPEDFLATATDGLTVSADESRLLRMVAASFVRGGHHPSPVITGLVKAEAHHDLDALLARFLHLNRHMADAAAEILRWVDEHRKGHHPRPPPPAHAPSPPAHPPAARAASSRTPAPAPARAPAAAKPPPQEGPANHRGLGALDDMFKD